MNNDELKKYTEANRESWNEVTPVHQKHRKIDLNTEFAKPGYSTLDRHITEILIGFGLNGKNVAQLCCNNGRETLSVVNLGAKSAVGFDISDEAIAEANRLAEIADVNCKFVRTDVYEIDSKFNNSFDIILITIGALYWLPDLPGFFNIANSLLREKGNIVIYDSHPFCNMLGLNGDPGFDPELPHLPLFSYFRQDPWVSTDGIDYIGATKYEGKVNYGWSYKMSDIINGLIGARFNITKLIEYRHDISDEFRHFTNNELIPLSYMLTASKM